MKNFILLISAIFTCTVLSATQQNWCAVMDAVSERLVTDAEYATFHQAATSVETRKAIPCDPSNAVIIPLAFHFDDSFSCIDQGCLLTKVQEQIDALNYAYADNSTYQQNIDLAAACPIGYPLADVSTGTCIEFRIGAAPAGVGLEPTCDPAITIGDFGGGTQTGLGGAGAAWTGYLNIFVVEAVAIYGFPFPGIIGVADGIPGMANGDGVTILADAFGGIGTACNSGNDLDIGLTANGSTFFTEGGTTVHEIGHYLGLYHIWGDDDNPIFGTPPYCNGDDSAMPQVGPFAVNDTPLQGASTPTDAPCPTIAGATCASLPATCDGSNDYFHNYMDYSNDVCFSMFTSDQSMVVNYWANELFGNSTTPTLANVPAQLTTICEMQPCAACASVNLDVLFDANPGQTSWDIVDSNTGNVVASGNNYGSQPANSNLNISAACLPDGCYTLNVYDAVNNGMCPFQSNATGVATFITPGTLVTPGSIVGTLSLVVMPNLCGNYTLTDAAGNTLASGGGSFGATDTNNFCLSGGVGPKLSNNTLNNAIELLQNPVKDQLLFQLSADISEIQSLKIVNLNGEILEDVKSFSNSINTSNLSAGIYWLNIYTNDGQLLNKKFVKQ